MSVEAAPVALAPQLPEFGAVPQTPEEAFASQVAWVRENGDALDVRARLWPGRAAMVGAVAGVAGGLSVTTAAELGTNATVVTGTAAAVSVVASAVTYGRERGVRNRAISRQDLPTQEALDLRYELFRTRRGAPHGKGEVVMLWHGAWDNRGAESDADALRRLAELAKQNGVTRIAMGVERYQSAVRPELALAHADKPNKMPLSNWLVAYKRLATEGRTQRGQLIDAPVDYWLDVAGNPVDIEPGRGIDGLLAIIAAADPRHPAGRIAHDFKDAPEVQRVQLLQVLKQRLEMRLDGTERVGVRAPGGTAVVARTKAHTSGRIHGESVEMWANGSMGGRMPIDQALEMNGGRIEAYLSSGDPRHRAERLTAAELALYRTLYRQDQAHQSDQVIRKELQGHMSRAADPHGVQMELGARLSAPANRESVRMRRQGWLRIAAAAGMLVLGTGLASFTSASIDVRYETVRAEALTQIEQERRLAPGSGQVTPEEIDRRLAAWSGANEVWGSWYEYRKDLHDWKTPDLPAALSNLGLDSPSRNNGAEYIGNVEDKTPRVIWNLEAHGMDAGGYWLSDTAESADTIRGHENFAPSWNVAGPEADMHREVLTIPTTRGEHHGDRPWVRVSRTVDASNFQGNGSTRYLPLPLRQNAEIIAVNLGGKPVQLIARGNGSYAVFLPSPDLTFKDGPVPLEYWVQPSTEPDEVTEQNNGPYDTSPNDTVINGYSEEERKAVDNLLAEHIPAYAAAGTNANAKRKAVYDYLKNEFLYSKTPFTKEQEKNIQDWTSFARTLLENKLGNCNVESTLLIMADPRLTAAFGFINHSGDGSNALMSGEAHMATLDGYKIIDPVSANVFVPPAGTGRAPESLPLLPWMILAAGITLAGAAVSVRKEAMSLATNGTVGMQARRADKAEAELKAMGPFALNVAAEAASSAAWSPDRHEPYDVIADRAYKRGDDPQAAYGRIMDPSFRDKGTPGRMANHKWDTKPLVRLHKLAGRVAARPAYHQRRK
jgi:hypothetical protein